MKDTKYFIRKVCRQVEEMLIDKNTAYGDSAIHPLRIFSSASAREQLYVRLDDKLSRIKRGEDTDKVPENERLDAVGYLILDLVLDEVEEYERQRNQDSERLSGDASSGRATDGTGKAVG